MSWTDPVSGFRRLTVAVLGNPGLDTLVLVGEDDPDLRADGHFVRNVDTVGHAAAFVARGLARLGHEVRLLGSVGRDPIGRLVEGVCAEDGVSTERLFTDPTGTARSVNLVFPDGRRTFFYDGGAHMTLHPPEPSVRSALAGADVVVTTLANWARDLLAPARAGGALVVADLQDVRDPLDPYRTDFVAGADVLFASAAHLPDPVGAARTWFGLGPATTVVFGRGPRGALLVSRQPDGVAVLEQPPAPADLPVVDTTGCGDSLAVGYLDGRLALGCGDDEALRRGQVLARIVASDLGGGAPFDRARLDGLRRG